PDLTPQSPGLLAISQGLKRNFADDYAMLAQGMIVYDALYSWCRSQVRPGART
ncbi:MAG: chromate resistance protein, partial [Alphaproteobacteria bacterium]|nr:chromate resistance protein [Alphaproteobacteria bacterium]